MRIGPLEIKFNRNKSYEQLSTMIRREQGGDVINLKTQPKIQLQEYRSWAYACVSLISDRISTLPFSFYRKSTGEELSQTNKSYKIFTKPFFNPNDMMTFRFIKAWCQIQLDLCGMAALWKGYNKLGQVWELWPLNMNDFMKMDVEGDFYNPKITLYFSSGVSGYLEFDINELVFINYVHPADPWRGASPVQAQAYAQDIDTYIEVYERDFFKNSARIDFALTTKEAIDQEKADEIKQRWKEKYQGSFHDVAVLDSDLKPVPLQYANRDFEFLNLAQWSMEKVLAAYRVPKSKIGFTDSNRSSDVHADISFNRESIQPRLSIWDEELTQGILSSFNSDIEIKHQNPIPRDRLIEVQEGRIHVGIPTMTIDEFRKETHKLEPVTNGNRIFIPKDMIPLDRIDEIIDSQLKAQEAASDKPTGEDPEDDSREDETPHTNHDGSDDRDDNPTDGRSIDIFGDDHFKYLCCTIKKLMDNHIRESLFKDIPEIITEEELEHDLKDLFVDITLGMVSNMLTYFGAKAISTVDLAITDWIAPITDKVVAEYKNTLMKNSNWNQEHWPTYLSDQLDSNPRLSKIVNALSKGCINYVKWMVFRENKETFEWHISSNECGHKGRLKEKVSTEFFKSSNTRFRFPNESINFSCDCTLIKNSKE